MSGIRFKLPVTTILLPMVTSSWLYSIVIIVFAPSSTVIVNTDKLTFTSARKRNKVTVVDSN